MEIQTLAKSIKKPVAGVIAQLTLSLIYFTAWVVSTMDLERDFVFLFRHQPEQFCHYSGIS